MRKDIDIDFYPLRPELIESTYMLYQATQDDYYLNVGKLILNDLEKYTKTKCGYATLKNIHQKSKDDRMESFFLSETLKYLYLLFDSENLINNADSDFVFNTEGHVLVPLGRKDIPNQKNMRGKENSCTKFHKQNPLNKQPLPENDYHIIEFFVDNNNRISNTFKCHKGSVSKNDIMDFQVDLLTLLPSNILTKLKSKNIQIQSGKLNMLNNGDMAIDSLHGAKLLLKSFYNSFNIIKVNNIPLFDGCRLFFRLPDDSLLKVNHSLTDPLISLRYILRIFNDSIVRTAPKTVNSYEKINLMTKSNNLGNSQFVDFILYPGLFGKYISHSGLRNNVTMKINFLGSLCFGQYYSSVSG